MIDQLHAFVRAVREAYAAHSKHCTDPESLVRAAIRELELLGGLEPAAPPTEPLHLVTGGLPLDIQAELARILEETGEDTVAKLGAAFARLEPIAARKLHERLTMGSASDPLIQKFGELSIAQRTRLLGYLLDTRGVRWAA